MIHKLVNLLRLSVTITRSYSMDVKTCAYGAWSSPISSKLVSESSVSFQEVRVDPKQPDRVYWSECRFDEGGRYVVCCKELEQEKYQSLTPEGYNARSLVHEYGGGAFMVYDGTIYFSNFKDQRMYAQKDSGEPVPLTPTDCDWRYADYCFSPKTGKIYCIREDHSGVKAGTAKECANMVVVIDPVSQQQTVLASGADFYCHPRVSPDGKSLCWVQWNHPNMPWDTTELWVASLNEAGDQVLEGTATKVAGGDDTSVVEPEWTPENGLLYVSDKSDWWNLYLVNPTGPHIHVLDKASELGGPHWQFNCPTYAVDHSGSGNIFTSFNGELGVLNMKNGSYVPINTGFSSNRFLNLTSSGDVYICAGSPTKFSCIVRVQPADNQVTVLRESKVLSLDKGYFSIPEAVTYDTSDGDKAHGYYYPPMNKDYQAPEGTLPPLLVKAHGGPTAQASNVLNLKIQYFTSRGFAVLDVNYRGSTGYGRQYRMKLKGKWGIYDVDDCCMGAEFLAKTGKVDKDKLCIDGGSAGGYTTLACLTFKSTFKAGASHYGICDLEVLANDTHKFESRYLDTCICPYTGSGVQVYKDRSPINFVDRLNCSMAFFQGDEDKIVPPNQAQMMFDAVKKKGLKTMFVLFKGEQHGFRKAENIEAALEGELYFFSKVFGFEAADINCKTEICNM